MSVNVPPPSLRYTLETLPAPDLAREEDVEVAVVVVVAPRHGAVIHADQGRADVGKQSAAVVAVHPWKWCPGPLATREEDVEVAVVVVVAPGDGAVVGTGKCRVRCQ